MEEVMCLEGERQYFERYLWFYGESAIISMFICEKWDRYSFLTKITEGGLDNDTQRRENGSARLGSARLGSAVVLRLFFSVSSSITLNYRVKSGSRVNYALISDFFFCGKGEHC